MAESKAQKYKEIAEDTLKILERGIYISNTEETIRIKKAIATAVANSEFHNQFDFHKPANPNINPTVTLTNESVLAACQRLHKTNPVALNFANATSPGGGFKRGAVAQEETIARSSALYPTLIANNQYYEINERLGNCYYSDGMIYSPDVPVFKDDYGFLLDEPYKVSFITSPAPMRNALINEPDADWDEIDDKIETIMVRRIAKVLRLAAARGHRNLILGAWGCGAFGNDAGLISELFDEQLQAFPYFDNILFAVYDDVKSYTYKSFEEVFG